MSLVEFATEVAVAARAGDTRSPEADERGWLVRRADATDRRRRKDEAEHAHGQYDLLDRSSLGRTDGHDEGQSHKRHHDQDGGTKNAHDTPTTYRRPSVDAIARSA